MAEKRLAGISFGTLMAFAAPGFIGLVAVSYQLPLAGALLDAARVSEQSVGVFLFSALASLACGVIISGIRDLALDPLICSGCRIWQPIKLPALGFSRLKNADALAAFEAAIENYYRYYQFYGNSAVALVVLLISHAVAKDAPPWPFGWRVAIIVLCLIQCASAVRSLKRYERAANDILLDPGESHE